MKNYAERFSRLEDLPVSEETLGAYLEGNLSPDEEIYLSELIESDPDLYMINDLPADDFTGAQDDYIFPEEEYSLLELPEESLLEIEASVAPDGDGYEIVYEDNIHGFDFPEDHIPESDDRGIYHDGDGMTMDGGWDYPPTGYIDGMDIDLNDPYADHQDNTDDIDWLDDDLSFDA